MAIKDILVQVDGGKSAPARYAAAIELARTHSAHLTGLCLAIEPTVPVTILGMVPPEAVATQREAVREQGETAIAQFRLALERAAISGEGRIVQVRDFDAVDVFIQHGRHRDSRTGSVLVRRGLATWYRGPIVDDGDGRRTGMRLVAVGARS